MGQKKLTILRAHCNRCGGDRRQEVLHLQKVTWAEEIEDRFSIDGGDSYELLKCCGCELISLRHSSWFSEDADDEGRPIVSIERYPPETHRTEPMWVADLVMQLPINNCFLSDLLKEIYVALRSKSLRLAVMGKRALLEQVMIDKIKDQGSFNRNLDEFQRAGHVSESQRSALEPVIDAGHAAMHRGFKPTASDVGILMDVAESIIESVYFNDHRSQEILIRNNPQPDHFIMWAEGG
ncbi:MAG: DUF4145 domain-containing protein [Panacagrimonas sp.]